MNFSSRFALKIAGVAEKFLQHTCTLENYEPTGSEDQDQQPEYTTVTVTDVPCLLLWKDVEVTDNRGKVLVSTPLVYFDNDQVVHAGSIVSNILNRRSVNILKSAKITSLDTTSEGGYEALQVAQLEGASL